MHLDWNPYYFANSKQKLTRQPLAWSRFCFDWKPLKQFSILAESRNFRRFLSVGLNWWMPDSIRHLATTHQNAFFFHSNSTWKQWKILAHFKSRQFTTIHCAFCTCRRQTHNNSWKNKQTIMQNVEGVMKTKELFGRLLDVHENQCQN